MIQSLRTLRTRMPRWGFTLIELAIVLGVAGVLFAGLWRLLSGGNQQLRDQSAASSQIQVINATKGYLASGNGQIYMEKNNGTTTAFALPLPGNNTTNAACHSWYVSTYGAVTGGLLQTFCDYLPASFEGPGGVVPPGQATNSYGDTFAINVVGDGKGITTIPNTYSFMIVASGGNTIPDSSGGRISAAIGGDGGFVYSSTSVCGATTNACGAYGAWTTPLATYGFSAAAAPPGSVATRTYVSPEQDSNLPWLARFLQPGDSPTAPNFNTMQTSQVFAPPVTTERSLFFNAATIAPAAGPDSIYMNGGAIHSGGGLIDGPSSITMATGGPIHVGGGLIDGVQSITMTGGGPITMNGGGINLGASAVATTGGGTVSMNGGTITGTGTSNISMVNPFGTPAPNSPILVGSGCNKASPTDATCPAAIQVSNGDVTVSNLLSANALYSTTFIYQGSDIRLKKNIHPLENALDDIMKLNPVSFTYRANGQESMGVIAQDLEKVYPQLVTRGDGIKSVSYEGLIGPLIESVQELKKENDELRAQIRLQTQRERNLENKLYVNEKAQ